MDFEKFCDWANIVLALHIKFLSLLFVIGYPWPWLSMAWAFKVCFLPCDLIPKKLLLELQISQNPRIERGKKTNNGRGAWPMGVGNSSFKHPSLDITRPSNAPDFAKLPRFIQDPRLSWRSQVICWRQIRWTSSDSERALPLSCTINVSNLAQKRCLDGGFMMVSVLFCFVCVCLVSQVWTPFRLHSTPGC